MSSKDEIRNKVAEIYYRGYEVGHHDTVESQYTDGKEQALEYFDEGEFSDEVLSIEQHFIDKHVEAVNPWHFLNMDDYHAVIKAIRRK